MSPRREQRVTRAGLGHVVLTCLLGLGAINSQNNLLYFVFGLSAAAILVSGVISGSMLLGLRVEREPMEPGQAGEPWAVRYRVRNESRWLPAFAVLIQEEPPKDEDDLPARARPWPAFMARPVAFLAHVGPRSGAICEGVVTPTRRGVAGFSAIRAESVFPFGLFRKSVFFTPPSGASAIIRPRVRPLREPVRRVAMRGMSEAPSSGDLPGPSDEFFGLREYAPGDSLRRVAWRRSARTGTLAVREHAAPAPARLWIALDLLPDPSTDADSPDERAIELAAAIAASAEREGLEVGLLIPGPDGPARVRPGASPHHIAALLDALGVIDLASIAPLASIDVDPRAAALVISAGRDRRLGPAWATHWDALEAVSRFADAEGRS